MKLNGKQKQALYNALLSAFPTRGLLAQMMVFEMDENLETVAGGETYSDVVLNLLQWADAQGRLEKLIVGGRAQNSGNQDLLAFAVEVGVEPPPEQPQGDEEQDEEPDSGEFSTLEPIINRSHEDTAFDIESLASLYRSARQASRAVCRIEAYQSMATGFLVAPDIIITAYFAVQDLIEDSSYVDPTTKEETPLQPSNIAFRFGYETDDKGIIPTGQIYNLATDWHIASSPSSELDFALLRLHAAAGHDLFHLAEGTIERGWLKPAAKPRLDTGSKLYILHHPAGGPLKFSSGTLLGLTETPSRCAYNIFTAPGSSGAPCFNAEWEVIAMHEKREVINAGGKLKVQDVRNGVLVSEIIKRDDVREALNL